MSETVIKFIILSGQKIRSRILQFRVGSDTCWFRKVRLIKFYREPAVGQFGFKLGQFISGRLRLDTDLKIFFFKNILFIDIITSKDWLLLL